MRTRGVWGWLCIAAGMADKLQSVAALYAQEYRGLGMIAVCCGVAAIQGGPAEWACRWQRNGATLTSQRSERENRWPAGLDVVLQQVVGAEVRAERRCRGSRGGCSAARAGVQSAEELVHCGLVNNAT